MYELQDWAAVQRVYKQTGSKRETARILGISRNTVRKLLKLTEPPSYHRTDYKSCIDGYKEQIITWRCKPYEFNGTRIYRELKALGYTVTSAHYLPFQRFRQSIARMVNNGITYIQS